MKVQHKLNVNGGNDITAECVLTRRDRVVNAKAAENHLDISGMEEPVPFDHHLEGF